MNIGNKYRRKHPELQEGEVFLRNTDSVGFRKIGWKTKRQGRTPYDVYGNVINSPSPNFFPVFVQRSELEEAGISSDQIDNSPYGLLVNL